MRTSIGVALLAFQVFMIGYARLARNRRKLAAGPACRIE